MRAVIERTFRIVEYLASRPGGVGLSTVAKALDMPLSATHRLLGELVGSGYVRQEQSHGEYVLTTKWVALGLDFLSCKGIVAAARPVLDALARECGELVRLAIVDVDSLTFVAKAQGAASGLRYDPDMGLAVALSCSAAGHAWLSTMTDEEALARVARQGFGARADVGPRAPTTIEALLPHLGRARARGYSSNTEADAPGIAAMAAPVLDASGTAIGVVTIAGPMVRLTEARMAALESSLIAAADAMARANDGAAPVDSAAASDTATLH